MKSDIHELKNIIKLLIENEPGKVKIRFGRGYGASHPFTQKQKISYGKTELDNHDVVDSQEFKKVKISKVFLNYTLCYIISFNSHFCNFSDYLHTIFIY